MKYQSNIPITAGAPFSWTFYVTNPDGSPVDITGATVTAYLAKHSNAIYALDTTADHTFYNYIPFTCHIENGQNGVFSVNLNSYETHVLEEGKYVYSATVIDINGTNLGEVISGLAFVSTSLNPEFGTVGPQNS